MRLFFLIIVVFPAIQCLSQEPDKVLISGIVVSTDSIPVPDVAIINTRTGKTVRTNENGYFQTEIAVEDSLMAYHIAFKRQFISEKNNGRYIVLEPEIQELMQVDVSNHAEQEQKNLEQTVSDIKRLAPMKKLSGYDLKSRQVQFVDENGSHNKGFSPFFGPTIHIPFEKIAKIVTTSGERRQLRKLTSHYHLVKKEKIKQYR